MAVTTAERLVLRYRLRALFGRPRTEVTLEITPRELVLLGDGETGQRITIERLRVSSVEWRVWAPGSEVRPFDRIVFRDSRGGPVGWWDLGLGPLKDQRVVRWLEQHGFRVNRIRGADALGDVVIAGRNQGPWAT